jgi:ABC-type phosphate transport system permease subunit
MKKVLLFWQKLHCNIYKFNCFAQVYVFGLPITLLLKNKYIIKQYEKRSVKNPSEIVRRTLINPETSTVNLLTNTFVIFLMSSLLLSILNIITAIAGYMIWADWSFLIYLMLIGVPSVLINYFALWKDDKYLVYYKEFEKESKQERLKWAWISSITVILILLLLIFSFWIMTNNIA